MHVSMRFLKNRLSIVRVVVMLFVIMDVVVFDFIMRVCMCVMSPEEENDPNHHQGSGDSVLDFPSLA